ncbi:C40 family peptidase [Fodinicola acaciae]|uniref:C40 family peptidase n=1 Tax=Fodinicola acaciae TaxID=2681555 RepID=UPI0013D82078|nr:C40 family peptidase [Fodinicola acaciae]
MREKGNRVLAGALGASLVVGFLLAPSMAAAAPTPPNPTDQQLAASRQQVAAASKLVGIINGQLAASQAALSAAQVQTEVAIEAYNTAVYLQGQAQTGYNNATRALKTVQAAVASQRSQMDHLVAATYMTGGANTAAMLMTGGNPANYGHELAMLDIVSGDQAGSLARLQQAQGKQKELANAATIALKATQAAASRASAAKNAAIAAITARQKLTTTIQAQQAVLNQRLVSAQRTAGLLRQARAAADARAAAARAAANDDDDDPPSSGGGGGGYTGGGSGSTIVRAALTQLGKPYVWAAASPSVGFDCSGLVLWAYKKVGIYLPHSAHLQYAEGRPISRSQLRPGDLVFWSYGSSWTSIHHVAIWAGNGKIIEAADFGIPVHKRSMYWSGYFGAARLL